MPSDDCSESNELRISDLGWSGTINVFGNCVFLFFVFALVANASASSGDELARRCIKKIQEGKVQEALNFFDKNSLPNDAADLLNKAREIIPASADTRIDVAFRRFNSSFIKDTSTEFYAYHVHDKNRAALIFATISTKNGVSAMTGFRYEIAPMDLRQRFPFTIFDKSRVHRLFLFGVLVVGTFVIITALVCIRSRVPKKWLWLVFIFVGIGKVSLVWAGTNSQDARFSFFPVSIHLFPVGFTKFPIYDPWLVSMSLPLGAILFYWALHSSKNPWRPTLIGNANVPNQSS